MPNQDYFVAEKFRNKYRIPSARLATWDYSADGSYFVTICARDRGHVFGEIKNGAIIFSDLGVVAEKCWREIPTHFPHVRLDAWVVMPDHVHGIVVINRGDGFENIAFVNNVPSVNAFANNTSVNDAPVETQNFASLRCRSPQPSPNKFGPQSKNLASIIRGFKIGVKKFATMNRIDFAWQTRFHEHVIRNEDDLNRIRAYVQNNPANWATDNSNLSG